MHCLCGFGGLFLCLRMLVGVFLKDLPHLYVGLLVVFRGSLLVVVIEMESW